MRYFWAAALACCLVTAACVSSVSSSMEDGMRYRERGLGGRRSPVEVATATKIVDRNEPYADCVAAYNKVLAERPDLAPYLEPGDQCDDDGNGLGRGGVPYGPFSSIPQFFGGNFHGVEGVGFLNGAGAPQGRELRPHRVVFTNGSYSLPVQISMDGRPLQIQGTSFLLPRGEAWFFLSYQSLARPTVVATPPEECHTFSLVWLSPATGAPLYRGEERMCFRPFEGGNRRTLRPPR